jgi:hypothetical protein
LGENPPALVTQAGLGAAPTAIDTEVKNHVRTLARPLCAICRAYFQNRDITLSLENSGFQRAKVQSKILDFQPVR